ncbi:MAG: hypothetical protein ACK5MZ_02990 [Aestuariibaculum sp.]
MALSSNTIFELLNKLDSTPQFMIFWAAFGVPLIAVILGIVVHSVFPNIKNKKYTWLIVSVAIIWIVGFVSMMLLYFAHVASGFKLLLIWFALLATVLVFSYTNRGYISKGFGKLGKLNQYKGRKR